MKRPVLAIVAAVAVLVVAAATAVAVTAAARDDHGPGMMSSSRWWPGDRDDGPGPGSWMPGMPGASATSEFAYLAEMVAHHEEAVAAASELERSDRPQLRAFGRSVVSTQSRQIDQMRAWLEEWYPGRSTDVEYDPMMRDLSGLSGDELDRAFLQDMVGHHMMAVMMSQHLLLRGVAEHAEVADLARTIRDEQHREIFVMQSWLREWFDEGWRHGWAQRDGDRWDGDRWDGDRWGMGHHHSMIGR
jgi:uncharacterized protein (DUF305 family)